MTENSSADTTKWKRIDVLMKEYDMLRQVITSRCNNRFAVVGFLAALTAFISTESDLTSAWRLTIGATAAALLLAIWWRFGQLIVEAADRVAVIERSINRMVGEELLMWESRIRHATVFRALHS